MWPPLVLGVFAQEGDEVAWVLLEQGHLEFSRREYGRALEYYKSAVNKGGFLPEAELAIGDVFWESGEPELAELQYRKAYDLRDSFYVPAERYTVYYRLAFLYESLGNYKQMEDTLLEMLADDAYYASAEYSRFADVVSENYLLDGLDQVLVLYRLSESFSVEAQAMLGWLYYRTGRYMAAVQQSLFGIVPVVSEAIGELRRYDPDYVYADLSEFFDLAFFRADIERYLLESEIFARLYYLAAASFAAGYPERALSVWNHIADSAHAGRYADLSQKQAMAPWVEPLLSISE